MNESSEESILYEINCSVGQLELFVVRKLREVSVDHLGRNFVQRVRVPLRLSVPIDQHRPNAFVEIGAFAESTNKPKIFKDTL